MSDDEYEESTDMVPPILIDESILTSNKYLLNTPNKPPMKAYSVDDTTFYEDLTSSQHQGEDYVSFEIYAEKLTNLANRKLYQADEFEDESEMVFFSTEDDEQDDNQELEITIKMIPQGIVINSNVFLTDEQWNTIINIDSVLVKCVVCELYSDVNTTNIHIQGELHKMQLNKYKPLAKFDLSVTRKIGDAYHCAVCNEAFSINADNDHYASKSHEGNLLSAINKVSDFNLNCIVNNNGRNTNSYHFDRENVNNDKNKNNDRNRLYDSYKAAAAYKKESSESDSQDDDFEYDCNENNNNDDDFFWETERNAQPGNSYATMLKKPKLIEMPLFLEKDLGSKKVKVKFDSWHMLISPKANRFYCMVCKEFSHIRCKPEHCAKCSHLENLMKCNIVSKFGDYLIREVDSKYYHCGHCNNLVIINDVEDHIEKNHSKYNKNAVDSSNATKNKDNDKNSINDDNGTDEIGMAAENNDTKNDNSKAFNDNKENINVMNTNEDEVRSFNKVLYENIVLNPFGYNITVPILSFNVLCKRPNDYYCGLCNVLCAEEMIIQHIYSIPHLHLLQRTPFILPFNCNLIRAIREALHCAICNIPIAASIIYIHIREPQHLQLLSKALNINTSGVGPSHNPLTQYPMSQNTGIMTINNQKLQLENKTTNKIVTTEPKTEATQTTEKPKAVTEKIETTKEPKAEATEITEKCKAVTEETTKEPKTEATDTTETSKAVTEKIEITKAPNTEITEIPKIEITKENKKELIKMEPTTSEVDLNVSIESDFDIDRDVYVKLKNTFYRINVTAYHTLVPMGDSKRYCFVCSSKVDGEELKKHVESRSHLENMVECKFLERDDSLFRQIFLMYHCSTCNVLVSRKEFKNHLLWSTHVEEIQSILSISKRMRKNDLKSGTNMYIASTQKEIIYLNEKETEIKVIFKVKIIQDKGLEKKMKIIIVNGDVLKLSFDNWNGVVKDNTGLKCQLCQMQFSEEDLVSHISNKNHTRFLNRRTFNEEYVSDLMRQINQYTLHCMVCNTEVASKDFIVEEHIGGKKHKKNYDAIRNISSTTNAYTDCEGDVLQL